MKNLCIIIPKTRNKTRVSAIEILTSFEQLVSTEVGIACCHFNLIPYSRPDFTRIDIYLPDRL